MKTLPIVTLVLVLLLLGAATLFAEPKEEDVLPLGLTGEVEVDPEQANALAKALAERPRRQVRVDATFLRIDAARADDVLGEHRPDVLGSARAIPTKLGRQLILQARGRGSVRPEPLPPLLLYDGLVGRLSATGRHTYLQDFDVENGMGGTTVGDAIVGRIEDGTRIDVTAHREAKRVLLDLDAVWAEVVRPIPIFEASHPKVTIELPELRLFQVKKEVEVPAEGGYVLAGGGKAWDGETLRLVVLEVRSTSH